MIPDIKKHLKSNQRCCKLNLSLTSKPPSLATTVVLCNITTQTKSTGKKFLAGAPGARQMKVPVGRTQEKEDLGEL